MFASAMFVAVGAGGQTQSVRFATFNIFELTSAKLNQVDDAGRGTHPQLCGAAEIVQRVRPDVLLVNEIDFDAGADVARETNARRFLDRYLKVGQNGQQAIDYPYVFFGPVNTGVPTGLDLDDDGQADGPADAFGYGRYPGQYGMALYSRFPIDSESARTFQMFLWKDMPKDLMPDGQSGKPDWYSADEAAVLRLSSKSHWDVPVRIGQAVVHVLASHPTPPVFDGPEDRNGRRTFDEIRLWADYVTGGPRAAYLVDDKGRQGGLEAGALFVILGDLNADPVKDAATYGQPAIAQLLGRPRVVDPRPVSAGAVSGGSSGPPEFRERRTCDFGRIDYVLPCADLRTGGAGVFWPDRSSPEHHLVARPEASSDHRLVWVDVYIP